MKVLTFRLSLFVLIGIFVHSTVSKNVREKNIWFYKNLWALVRPLWNQKSWVQKKSLYLWKSIYWNWVQKNLKVKNKILSGKTDLAVKTGCHAGRRCCLNAELSGFFDSFPATLRCLTPSAILKLPKIN